LKRLKDEPAQGRLYIEPYEEAMERFDIKLKRNYRFVANPLRERMQIFYMYEELLE
jgi:hypothetical protein